MKTKEIDNYGILTEISKELNKAVGDHSGRTLSRRTAHGLRKSFDLRNVSDEEAEAIAHTAMIASGICLSSKDSETKLFGSLLTIALVVLYQNGK